MTPINYSVIFEGKIAVGREIGEVKRNLSSLFHIDEGQVDRLFTGQPVAIKKDVDYQTAMKYKDALERAGAICSVEASPGSDRLHPLPGEGSRIESAPETESFREQESVRSVPPMRGGPYTQRIPRPPFKRRPGRRYSIVHPLFMSFFSKDFYQDVGRNWKGFSFVYLLFVLFLCWIPTMITLQHQMSDFVHKSAKGFLVQIPKITILRGELSIDEKEPYFIRDPENGEVFAIIDTTGHYASLDDGSAKILITKKKVILRKSMRETRTFDLSDIENFVLDQDLIAKWMKTFEKWFVFILLPLAVFGSFLYRTVQVLIYAAIGILFSKAVKIRLGFQSLMSIAIMAITPVLIVNILIGLTKVSIPLWSLWCFIIAMGFLYYGVKANADGEILGDGNNSATYGA
jgi:hypothetical protein